MQKIAAVLTGLMALRESVSLQTRLKAGAWVIALTMEAVRRTDEAVERSWQDRLAERLEGCRAISRSSGARAACARSAGQCCCR